MSQALFINPFVSAAPVRTGTGNGTLSVDRLTHHTVTQTYTATCIAVAPFTAFRIAGSLDGPVGTAVVGTQFIDPDLKIFLTINQGPTAFVLGDQFTWEVTQGTDLTQENIDDYDELPQKNFSAGNVGTNSGDDNLRFKPAAQAAKTVIQDLTYTAATAGKEGNELLIEYENTSSLLAASLLLQDALYTAVTPGSGGNAISIEYEDWTPPVSAFVEGTNVRYEARTTGTAGNGITVEHTDGAPTSTPVISVVGTDITIQVQNGVTTVQQVKTAVFADVAAKALIFVADLGDDLATIVAPEGPLTLAGGTDAVGAAGSEVVSVVGNAIKVKLQNITSTAQQVVDAVNGHAPAAALVTASVAGSATAVQVAPEAATNLSGGSDAAGTPGSEVITVTGTRIKVGFQSGVNTAQNIRDKVMATPAATALVSVAVTGTAGTAQTAPTTKNLSGGADANSWAYNSDELSDPSNFFDGNGNLVLNKLFIQETATFRKAVKNRGVVSLDDINATANGSGPAVTNLQKTLNHLISNDKIFVNTDGSTKIRWNAPQLFLLSAIEIHLIDAGVINRVVQSNSPITINDGQSVWVTLNRSANADLTINVSSSVPADEHTFRLVTRLGDFLVFWDNSVLGENQVTRIGAGIDLSQQVFNVLAGGGIISHSATTVGEISWDGPLYVKPLGSSEVVTIPPSTITLADDEVAYVILQDPVVSESLALQKTSRSQLFMSRPDTFWIFIRSGSKIIVRNGSSLVQGEERQIGEPISQDIFTYIGSTSETDSDPDYQNANGAPTSNRYITDGDNLTKALKKIDTRLGIVSDLEQDDRNLALVRGGNWSWNSTSGELSFDAIAYVQIPFQTEDRNRIPLTESPITLSADGQVAYVELERTAGAANDLTVQVAAIDSLIPTDNTLIIARRIGTKVLVADSMLLENGEARELGDGISNQTLAYIGAPNVAASAPDYENANGSETNAFVGQGNSHTVAIKKLDQSLHRFFSQLRIKPMNPVSKRVQITGADATLLDGTVITQELQSKILKFDGAQIDFDTGEIFESDGTTLIDTFTPASIPTGEFHWYAIALDVDAANLVNEMTATIRITAAASSGISAAAAAKADLAGDKPLGQVYVQESAGSIATISAGNIRQLGVGSGSGSGSGGAITVKQNANLISSTIKKLDFRGKGIAITLPAADEAVIDFSKLQGGAGGTFNADDILTNSAGEVLVNDDGNVLLRTSPEPLSPTHGIEADEDGNLDITLKPPVQDFILRSPDFNYWRVSVSNLGALTTALASNVDVTDVAHFKVTKPDLSEAEIVIDNSGVLSAISPVSQSNLTLNDSYYLESPDGSAWRITVDNSDVIVTEKDTTEGNILRVLNDKAQVLMQVEEVNGSALHHVPVFTAATLPVTPTSVTGCLPWVFYDNGVDKRPIFWDGAAWRYVADNSVV